MGDNDPLEHRLPPIARQESAYPPPPPPPPPSSSPTPHRQSGGNFSSLQLHDEDAEAPFVSQEEYLRCQPLNKESSIDGSRIAVDQSHIAQGEVKNSQCLLS